MTSDFFITFITLLFFERKVLHAGYSVSLSYFLYGSTYRQYLTQFPGPLYQPACYQQVDPEAGAESGYRSFLNAVPGVSL